MSLGVHRCARARLDGRWDGGGRAHRRECLPLPGPHLVLIVCSSHPPQLHAQTLQTAEAQERVEALKREAAMLRERLNSGVSREDGTGATPSLISNAESALVHQTHRGTMLQERLNRATVELADSMAVMTQLRKTNEALRAENSKLQSLVAALTDGR